MRFWDTSAVVPLVAEEVTSRRCRDCFRADRQMVVWCLTRTEALSALCRHQREGRLTLNELAQAVRRLDSFSGRWTEVDALLPVRETASRLLRTHPLRAGDSLQLAAALVLVDHRPQRRAFVCLDDLLSAAASAEGFEVLPHP